MPYCPQCKVEKDPQFSFCPVCGSRLEAAPPPASLIGGHKGEVIIDRGDKQAQIQNVNVVVPSTAVPPPETLPWGDCPICGRYVRRDGTFRCRTCGQTFICLEHLDRELRMCSDCAEVDHRGRQAQREAEERARREAEAKARLEAEERARRAPRRTFSGLAIATPENLASLLAMPQLPARIWWEKAEIELCLVPAGEFLMGISEQKAAQWAKEFGGQVNWYKDAAPQHKVQLSTYYIGRTPVTNAQYARFLRDETGHRVPFENADWAKPHNWDARRRSPPAGKEQHPVVLVSWDDAVAYSRWAGLRLPSEAEWEKAAGWDPAVRKKRLYPWGDAWDGRLCNSAERIAGRALPTYDEWKKWWDAWNKLDAVKRNQDTTTPVGAHSPAGDSPYCCADMAGNVWEWCADWYDSGYYGRSPAQNPPGPDSGSSRALRGGSWDHNRHYARCAYRDDDHPDSRFNRVGFRVVVVPGSSRSGF